MSNVCEVQYSDGTQEQFAYDLVGQLVYAKNQTGELILLRDRKGRIVRETRRNLLHA